MTDITFTRIEKFQDASQGASQGTQGTQGASQDTTQVSQIIYDNIPVAWIEYDTLKRVIVYQKDDWYYVNGDNLTVQKVVEALGYKRFVVSWAERGERYEIRDELVIHAPQCSIRVFSNPNHYLDYSEYDDLETF